ncbi:cyclin-H-like [Anneissia japonica]|uniref:cyclin-H-like n=1 Tax=Anneissia japonica TaxID=1529436 RepID=UPI0014256260|nr:cyclin-H-like [Anneissia japonica]XP_033107424.1 cyclin-H-like [Anneissia japonica]
MFHSSTQRKFWTFHSEEQLLILRKDGNQDFITKHEHRCKSEDPFSYFLTEAEERLICRHYEHLLRDLCRNFEPPMPSAVMATACAYLKRFYLQNSVMDHHPKYIMLTCLYLGCKVEEFNVSIVQFCANVQDDPERAAEVILTLELLVMQSLNFHLTVHNPYRPLEGFIIDLKTRYTSLRNPDQLRQGADEFLHRCIATDACLLFTPSQISLAALVTSASKSGINIDSYVTDVLLGPENRTGLRDTVNTIKRMKCLVKNIEPLNPEIIKKLERKLEKCRNQELNPDSEIYKQKLQAMLDDEEEAVSMKRDREAKVCTVQLQSRCPQCLPPST